MPFPLDGDTKPCNPKDSTQKCDLYAGVMPPVPVKSDVPAPQTIQVNVVLAAPQVEREPTHLKVHHNTVSIVARAIGHFGKEYALGVRDSVKPRNLGMETLPIALNEYNAIRLGNGLKQLGQGEEQLAAGEQQLGAGLSQLGSELGALQGAGSSVAGSALRSRVSSIARSEVAVPKAIAPGRVTAASEGLSGQPRATTVSANGIEAGVATPTQVALPNGSLLNVSVSSVVAGSRNDAAIVTQTGAPLTIDNHAQFLPNEGVNANGDVVAMTPKQLAKAQEYATRSAAEEINLRGAADQYNAQLTDAQKSMSTSPNAPAWFKMLDQRMTYFSGYDHQGDHKAARAWLSDANQCVDYLRRDAQSTHNDDAVRKLEALKKSIKELDSIEKGFGKTPEVVIQT